MKARLLNVVLILCTLCVLTTTNAMATVNAAITDAAKSRIEFGLSKSIVIGTFDNGKFNFFAHGQTGNQLTPNPDRKTVFEIGSITKVFMATLLADQVQQGRIKLSDSITDYLPENCKAPALKPMTLEMLATHFSGLPRMPSNYEAPYYNLQPQGYSHAALCEYLRQPEDITTAGAHYEYSNLGYGLLGVLLERVTEQSLNLQIEKVIAKPLSMTDTKIGKQNANKQRLAQGHHGDILTAYYPNGELDGAGAILSTAEDLLNFAIAHLSRMQSPISNAIRLTTQSHRQAWEDTDIGLGWHIQQTTNGQNIHWHNGSSGGFHSFIGFNRSANKAVVVMANSGGDGNDDLGFAFLDPANKIRPTPSYQPVSMSNDTLETFVGIYDTDFGIPITVSRDANQLRAQFGEQFALKIFPMSKETFFYRAIDATLSFKQTADGTSLFLHQGGETYPAVRRMH